MSGPEPATTREVLLKRVRRLLRLDRNDDRSELRAAILPFLNSLGSVALIGGAIRDVARAGRQGFDSDLDFVVYDSNREVFAAEMNRCRAIQNKFGGYGLTQFQWKIDVWHIEDTWAKTAGLVSVTGPRDLLNCTFFDWDSALYEIGAGNLIVPPDYFKKLRFNVMDVRLIENPNPMGSLVRALRRAALWRVRFGPKLTAFCRRQLSQVPWSDLVSLDARAFRSPVLRYLDRSRLLERLDRNVCSPIGEFTWPVPDWERQLKLPLEFAYVRGRDMANSLDPSP